MPGDRSKSSRLFGPYGKKTVSEQVGGKSKSLPSVEHSEEEYEWLVPSANFTTLLLDVAMGVLGDDPGKGTV
jgi:hypothetical protein